MKHWISVKKRLPKLVTEISLYGGTVEENNPFPHKKYISKEVLITNGKGICFGFYTSDGVWTTKDGCVYNITHWTNLPKIPRK